ncbi:hypothetical protein UNDKW_5668 [Undibacterium sp. KW1]|uniref:bpX6 domain-containing protein n=1 Tax=Undibacterium sp. KW1 TaxID=2058624 RepID=UPI001331D0EF|nr:bpX6 domain-containing protein [Undibacterium sp. KW1]BBB63941.1 hypothetical protein UNDKW_5668 [Undibacterium sp. KW1]
MMPTVRRPLFDGMRELRGIWFDPELIGESQARSRILHHWRPGSRLYQVLKGYFLEFPEKKYLHCAGLDGLAIAEINGILSSAPLHEDELAAISGNSFCLVAGAQILTARLTQSDRIDPSAWLDLSAISLRKPLKFPTAGGTSGIDEPAPGKDIRDILGDAIPQASDKQKAFLDETAALIEGGKLPDDAAQKKSWSQRAGPVALGALGLMASWLSNLIDFRRPAKEHAWGNSGAPEKLSPLAQKLANFAAKIANMTRMSKLLGERQARFLREMMEMFERGDLNEALRHAVPLDSLQKKNTRQAFGTPRRRDNLNISNSSGLGSSIHVASDVQEHLRQLYRRTFERLDREGKIDEAVFVLAELLKSGTEAVNYLESKDRIKQAAELADTLELSPEIRVRLWWLAGDFLRAAKLARLFNSFAEAVHLLEKKHAAEGRELRKHWAHAVATRGDLADAAEILWPLEEEREQALSWLSQAERAGGILGVRALTRKLSLQVSDLKQSEASIRHILNMAGEPGAQLRARLAQELLTLKQRSPASTRLAAEVLRHVLTERSAGLNQLQKQDITRLIEFADAAVMRTDLPALNLPHDVYLAPFNARSTPLEMLFEERGLMRIHDACRLPDAHYLLALGESGVSIVNQVGKQLAHYPVPAHHLVLSDNGQRALVLAKRDNTMRISRIDLASRSVADWLTLPVSFWSRRYDGIHWNVVMHNRLLAIDTSVDKLQVVWQIADLPGQIFAYSESAQAQTLLIGAHDGIEQWRYLLPSRRLNQRDSWALPDSDVWRILPVENADEPARLYLKSNETSNAVLLAKSSMVASFEVNTGAAAQAPEVHLEEGMIFVASSNDGMTIWEIRQLAQGKTLLKLALPSADHPGVHVQRDYIMLFDRAGRLVEINRSNGLVRAMTVS